VRRMPRRQLSNEDEPRAGGCDLILGAIQLDRVRAAIRSAVVPQPDERGRTLAPEVAKADISEIVVL
jgi:hypothetical protein